MKITLLLLATAMTFYLAIFYGSAEFSLLLLCEIFVPIAFLILAMVSSFLVKIRPIVTKSVATREDKVRIPIKITNKNIFPCPKITGIAFIENTFGKSNNKLKLNLSATAFCDEITDFTFIPKTCGIYHIAFSKLKLHDYLRIFCVPIMTEQDSATITVMPKLREIPVILTPNATIFSGDSDEYHNEKSGDDPSEIFNIREYHDGDKIRSIHWKQSAKADTLMVKEMSLPLGASVGIIINSTSNLDVILDYLACLSFTLVNQSCIHTVIWFDSKRSLIMRETVSDLDSLNSLFVKIFNSIPMISENLDDINDFPVTLKIDNKLDLTRNNERIFNLTDKKTEELVV